MNFRSSRALASAAAVTIAALSAAALSACSPQLEKPSTAPASPAGVTTTAQAPARTAAPAPAATVQAASPAADDAALHATVPETFDLQAHRGGRGESTEESRLAFTKALAQGVDTLELDIVLTKDNVPAVWHDPSIQEDKCRDTAPVTPGDPMFPYVAKDVHDLTWAQIQTLRCDKTLKDFPNAEVAKDNRILQLSDVFTLAEAANPQIRYNIETKIEGEERQRSASPEDYVSVILGEVNTAGNADRVSIQSFDWRTLPLVQAQAPGMPIVALYDETTWVPNSMWLGPVNFDAVHGNVIEGIAQLGAQIASPDWKLVDAALVADAHAHGLAVIPWTVNEKADMVRLINDGVDGIITDYPTRLQEVIGEA